MLFCINNKKRDRGTAGAKAPRDVFTVLQGMGAKEIVFYEPHKFKQLRVTRFFAFFTGVRNWLRLYLCVGKNDWIILQHPYENVVVANKMIHVCKTRKDIHFIGMVHDLDSLRRLVSASEKDKAYMDRRNARSDEILLKKCDYIICHNLSMLNYMVSRDFPEEKLIPLEIFDYLHECSLPERVRDKSIVVAGNLFRQKCGYLYNLLELDRDYTIHLFGPNYTESTEYKNVNYHGTLSAEILPEKLEGAFGLVWDGTELDTCSGSTGEYLRYNNPHKASLFLSSGLPIIIWDEAALAGFVKENGVGITVKSLRDISTAIDAVTEEEYNVMLENVNKIGARLKSGYYTSAAIQKCRMT